MSLTGGRTFLALVIALSGTAACSTAPRSAAAVPQAAPGVDPQRHAACHAEAVSAGMAAIDSMSKGAETFALVTGMIGAAIALGAAEARYDSAYRASYDACVARDADETGPAAGAAEPAPPAPHPAREAAPSPGSPQGGSGPTVAARGGEAPPRQGGTAAEGAAEPELCVAGVAYIAGVGPVRPWDKVPCDLLNQ